MNIIFHTPLPLNTKATSASGIRPLKMLSAFQDLGYNVDLITGYSNERRKCIKQIKKNIRNGKKYDFVYSESSTMPTILTDTHHLPLHPLTDYFFFKFCNKNNIPIGLFYRDIYWLFDNYGKNLSPLKRFIAKISYKFDLWVYKKTLKILYLPSTEMGKYIPTVPTEIFKTLPPGHSTSNINYSSKTTFTNGNLRLFYVGGFSDHYKMHKLFDAIQQLPKVELTICTREIEWLSAKREYPYIPANIKIVHLSGEEMEKKLSASDITMLFVEPHEYWTFASPVKLYEYLGYQKPIISSKGTLAGTFIKNNNIGWVIPYDTNILINLLTNIINDPSQLDSIHENLKKLAPNHSWQSRAKQVCKDLTQ